MEERTTRRMSRSTAKALAGSSALVVVTGALNKIGAASTRFVPRPIIRKIAGSLKL